MTSRTRSWRRGTTRSCTRSGRRPTGGSAFPARTSRARGPPPSSSPGTTATRTSSTSSSTSRTSARSSSGTATSRSTSRACWRSPGRSWRRPIRPTPRSPRSSRRASARSSSSAVVGPSRRRGRRRSSASSASSRVQTSSSIRPSSSSIPRARPSSRRARTSSSATSRSCASSRRTSRQASHASFGSGSASSPVAILGEERVEGVEVVRNRLEPDERGSVRAVATDERELIPCGIVFRSVGYRGVGVPGCRSTSVPARCRTSTAGSSRTTAPRSRGSTAPAGSSAARPASSARTRRTRPRPSSSCSKTLVQDGFSARSGGSIEELLAERGIEPVVYAGWEAIDALERSRGETKAARASSSRAGTSSSTPRAQPRSTSSVRSTSSSVL